MTMPQRDNSTEALAALYAADRADGSSIFVAAMQLAAVMVAYAAVAFATIATNVLPKSADWLKGLLALPMWSLGGFQLLLLALTATRVNSIRMLEHKLLAAAELEHHERKFIGSDAGDWVTNIGTQPWWLKIQTVLTYGGLWIGIVSLSIAASYSIHGPGRGVMLVVYGILAVLALYTAWRIFFTSALWRGLAMRTLAPQTTPAATEPLFRRFRHFLQRRR